MCIPYHLKLVRAETQGKTLTSAGSVQCLPSLHVFRQCEVIRAQSGNPNMGKNHVPSVSSIRLLTSPPVFSPCQVSNDSVNRTFTALAICEKGNEEEEGKGNNNSFPHLYNTALFIPEGRLTGRLTLVSLITSTHMPSIHSFTPTSECNRHLSMCDGPLTPFVIVRPLQSHSAEVKASGHLSHHSENPQSDSWPDYRQLQQEATATIQVHGLTDFLFTL